MKITDIRRHVKRGDRYSVYVDGTYLFSFSETGLLNSGLRIGQELTKTEILELKQKATLDKAYDRTLNLISIRRRSEWEISQYLLQKDYGKDTIEIILNTLRKNGYADDFAFAKAWVENRRLLKSTSKRRLELELRQKRIADSTIKEVINADDTDERDVLRELVARKRKQTRYKDDIKLMQYLIRQGYNYGDVKTVIKEA